MRCVSFVAVALLLGACADPYVSTTANTISSGEWKIERQADRVTGNAIASALLRTRNSSHSRRNDLPSSNAISRTRDFWWSLISVGRGAPG